MTTSSSGPPAPIPPTRRLAVAEGLTLAVRVRPCVAAVAPPVVLLPGTGATAEDWDAVAGPLSSTRTVYAVDLRGHGRSDRPGTYSIALMTADVTSLLARLPEPVVDLVGHSLGGLVALGVAARGGPVRRLVLEDVGLPHPRRPAPPVRPEGELGFDWAVVEQVRPEIDDPAPDWPDVIAAVTVPTLVIAGGPSSFVDGADIDEIVDLLPEARSVTMDTGHGIHAAQPAAFVEHLTGFLGG